MNNPQEQEKKFTLREINIQNIWINILWTMIAGFIWSVIIIIIMLALSKSLWFSLSSTWFESGIKINNIFPFFFSLITFIATTTTIILTYYILTLTDPNRYKKNTTTLFHLMFYSLIIYILITPVYIIIWANSYEDIFYIFLLHNLITFLWTSLILELLNNYRYIMLWFYWSFIWFFVTVLLLVFIFWTFSSSQVKIISFIILLPLINSLSYLFKQLFEYLYYQYYKYTWMDQLWDVFYQIEKEEKE